MTANRHDPSTRPPQEGELVRVVDPTAASRLERTRLEDAEMAEHAEAFASFVALLETDSAAPPRTASGRERLLRAISGEGRLSGFAAEVARLLDVTVDDVTFAHATAGAQGQRLAALIVGTRKENR